MKRFLGALAILAAALLPAQAQNTRAQLSTQITSNFPDNTTGLITPLVARTQFNNFVSSFGTLADANTWTAANTFTANIMVGTPGTPNAPISINLNSSSLISCPSGCTFFQAQGADNTSQQINFNTFGTVPASHNALTHILATSAGGTAAAQTAIGSVIDNSPNWQTTLGAYAGLFISGGGYDGSAYCYGASIAFRPAEAWGASAHGEGIMFGVTPTGTACATASSAYRFWMAPEGRFVINGSSAAPPALVVANSSTLEIVAANSQRATIELWTYGNAPNLFSRRADGTQSLPAAVATGSTLFGFAPAAYNGSTYVGNASIVILADETQTNLISSSYTSFSNTPKGSAVLQENVRLWGAGGVSVGTGNVATEPNAGVILSNGFKVGAAANTLTLKQGANGAVGTFVCNGVTPVTVNNSNVAISDAITISLNTVGGTVGAAPDLKTITAATGFTAACTAADTSTYNYAIVKNSP